MRLAVISDIHANREALDAVFISIENHSLDRIICLGDLVDYGVDFGYCIDAVRQKTQTCLMGNHDSTVAGKDPVGRMNREAQKSALWTMQRLTNGEKNYLGNLKFYHRANNMLFVHSTPASPEKWDYVTNWFDAVEQFDNFEERICFVGHSHVPGIYGREGEKSQYQEGPVGLSPEEKFMINVGSVGQPRDRDPRACYAIVDDVKETVEFIRLPYDVEKASQKIMATGVSQFNAQRILVGI